MQRCYHNTVNTKDSRNIGDKLLGKELWKSLYKGILFSEYTHLGHLQFLEENS